jgi:hypothetical protein
MANQINKQAVFSAKFGDAILQPFFRIINHKTNYFRKILFGSHFQAVTISIKTQKSLSYCISTIKQKP